MWWNWWTIEPGIVVALLISGGLYLRGAQSLWRQAGLGRGLRFWQGAAFVAGLAAIIVALLSPLERLAEQLFWMHMLQHLMLLIVAAPLLVLGRPQIALVWALPIGWRRRIGRWFHGQWMVARIWQGLRSLPVAWVISTTILWGWHVPGWYQAALRDPTIHAIEHGSFLATGCLFWWAVIHPARGRSGYGASILAVVTMSLANSVLGALITFATAAWYPFYRSSALAGGLTPLEDQQLAGLVMWVPAGGVYLSAAAILFVQWLSAAERSARQPALANAIMFEEQGVQR